MLCFAGSIAVKIAACTHAHGQRKAVAPPAKRPLMRVTTVCGAIDDGTRTLARKEQATQKNDLGIQL